MAITSVGSYTLGEINIGLAVGIGLMNPLLLQLDLFLTGQFGFGPFLADIQAQFNAAISAVIQLSIGISDPLAALRALLAALLQVQASLAVALSFPLPVISIQASAQVSILTSLSTSLSLKIGGIKAMLAAGLAVKIPALQFIADFRAALSAGPAHLLSFTGDSLAVTGSQIATQFAAGLGPTDPINPLDAVSGILILTKDPAVFAALGVILKIS